MTTRSPGRGALFYANTFPGGVVDLQTAVESRMFEKNLKPQASSE